MGTRFLYLLVLLFGVGCVGAPAKQYTIERVSEIDTLLCDINCGLAAGFCGVLDDGVLMVGGANFPELSASQGGAKRFYSVVYHYSNGRWHYLGDLPEGLASGGSAVYHDAMYLVGGVGAGGAVSSALRLSVVGGELSIGRLPLLPYSVEQCGAVVVDSVLYVVGGNHNGVPSVDVLALELGNPASGWKVVGQLPQAMLQPVVTAVDGVVYLWGGFSLHSADSPAVAYDYGYSMNPRTMGFKRVSGIDGATLTGGSAVVWDGCVYVVGGVDKSIFERAISRRYYLSVGEGDTAALESEEQEYMEYIPSEFRFSQDLRVYNPTTDSWSVVYSAPELALAGAGVAVLDGAMYVVNGEIMPGVRTNRVLCVRLD